MFQERSHRIANFAVLSMLGLCGIDSAVGARPSVDPCSTLCALYNMADCYRVVVKNGMCNRLYWDATKSLTVADTVLPGWAQVTLQEARNMVSIKEDSCQSICDKTPGCIDSFCKGNTHCQALFWESTSPQVFCYHSKLTSCNEDKPVLCGSTETNAPVLISTTSIEVVPTDAGMEEATTSQIPLESSDQTDSEENSTTSAQMNNTATTTLPITTFSKAVKADEGVDANQAAKDHSLVTNSTTTKSAATHTWIPILGIIAISAI